MNPSAAGTMAQVIAVLVLAVAFAPTFRGALPTPKTLVHGGRVYREAPAVTFDSWYRVLMTGFSLLVLAFDVVILTNGLESDDFWVRVFFALMNATAIGFLGATIMSDMVKHARDKSTAQNTDAADDS